MICACISHFSCVQLFVTLRTVACQAPLPMAFSWQEYWSGLPRLPPAECFGTPCCRIQPWRQIDIKWNSSLIIFYCEAWKHFLISLSFSFKKKNDNLRILTTISLGCTEKWNDVHEGPGFKPGTLYRHVFIFVLKCLDQKKLRFSYQVRDRYV